ncbi:MAG TPA: VOC family protein, partial [Streptomyces sp.]
VPAHNPHWDDGVTIADPEGYRLVLCSRTWT